MKAIGKIVQVSGPVVDVEFERGELPAIREALLVLLDGKELEMEVAQHLGRGLESFDADHQPHAGDALHAGSAAECCEDRLAFGHQLADGSADRRCRRGRPEAIV